MIRVHQLLVAVLALATFSNAEDLNDTTNKLLQPRVLSAHTSVPQPRPRSWYSGHQSQDEEPINVTFLVDHQHLTHYQDMLELADYLFEQHDENTGNPLYKVSIIADGSKRALSKETRFQLQRVTHVAENNTSLDMALKSSDLVVIDGEYEASKILEVADRPYLLIQGFETSDLKLAYESPTYRNTLVSDIPERQISEEPSAWETVVNQFAEKYRTMMIEDDKKFEVARRNGDNKSSTSCPREKALKIKAMGDQIEYFAKFGTKHLQPVALTRASVIQRHDLDIKLALAVLALATLLLIWMLAATIHSKLSHKSTAERILDESTDKKTD